MFCVETFEIGKTHFECANMYYIYICLLVVVDFFRVQREFVSFYACHHCQHTISFSFSTYASFRNIEKEEKENRNRCWLLSWIPHWSWIRLRSSIIQALLLSCSALSLFPFLHEFIFNLTFAKYICDQIEFHVCLPNFPICACDWAIVVFSYIGYSKPTYSFPFAIFVCICVQFEILFISVRFVCMLTIYLLLLRA